MIRGSYGSIYILQNIFLHHISFKGKKERKNRLKNFPERENAINMFCQTNKESNFSIFILRLSYFFFPSSCYSMCHFLRYSFLFFFFLLCWFGWKTFHVLFFNFGEYLVHYRMWKCLHYRIVNTWWCCFFFVFFLFSFLSIVVVFDIEFCWKSKYAYMEVKKYVLCFFSYNTTQGLLIRVIVINPNSITIQH